MIQQKINTQQMINKLINTSINHNRNHLDEYDHQLFIKRSQLINILEQFAHMQQQLNFKITELQSQNQKIRSEITIKSQQCQKFKHLLSIKDQICTNLKKQLEDLKNTSHKKKDKKIIEKQNKNFMSCSNLNQFQDLNQLSKIQSIDQDQYQQNKQNRGFQTKRKICLKKSINNFSIKPLKINNINKQNQFLQTAKFKQEINKLQQTINSLQLYINILQIQNQNLVNDNQLTNKRQRKIYESLIKNIKLAQKSQQDDLSKKCKMLQKCIDKLTQKLGQQKEKIDFTLNHPPIKKFNDIPPPITPHFSNSTFIFPQGKKTPSKSQVIPDDEIFEAYSSFSQQDELQLL